MGKLQNIFLTNYPEGMNSVPQAFVAKGWSGGKALRDVDCGELSCVGKTVPKVSVNRQDLSTRTFGTFWYRDVLRAAKTFRRFLSLRNGVEPSGRLAVEERPKGFFQPTGLFYANLWDGESC